MSTPEALTPEQAQVAYENLKKKEFDRHQRLSEMQAKEKEHKMVVEKLETMEPSRKCFRMIGGVLAERNVEDVLPELRAHLGGLGQIIESLRVEIADIGSKMEQLLAAFGKVDPAEASQRAAAVASAAKAASS